VRRIPIRTKLATALAVPLLALGGLTALVIVQSSRAAEEAREQAELAEAAIGPVSVLSVLENERNAAAVHLLGLTGQFALPVEDNAEARQITDASIDELRARIESDGGAVEEAYSPALDQLDALAELRAQIDTVPDGQRGLDNIQLVSERFDDYSALMAPLFAANRQVAVTVDDAELRRGSELVDLSGRQTNLIAILVRDLLLSFIGDDNVVEDPAEISALAATLGQLRTNERLIDVKATGVYRDMADDLFAAEEIVRFPEVVDQAIATGEVDFDGVVGYSAGDDPDTYGYTVFRERVTDALTARADELQEAAENRVLWFGILFLLAFVVALAITVVVSLSITRPLRSLTRHAIDMAERRLPDAVTHILETPLGDDVQVPSVQPVVVKTRDEVADVATALNTVQDTALDLAVEQAVLRRNIADSFVNLGRRNQNLLGRQLDFITELEAAETDPDTLANLFRLDHLATRMRRNAESLLVLAGVEPPRQWVAPVRITDVIRAALGEVEEYQRVTVRGVEPATIVGSAAADLAHLLAELIENALVFSPPDQTVDMRGRTRPDGAAGQPLGYTLAVIDSGLGMPAGDVAAANRRLAGTESFTIAPSKYLGHYVAGNLAARHDIRITLDNGPHGITATIDLPATLLTTDDDLGPELTPPHGHRAVSPQPASPALATAPTPPPPAAGPVPRRPDGQLEVIDLPPADPLAPAPPAPGPFAPAPPAPDPVGPYAPPPAPGPAAPVPIARTQSGLVKRNGRSGAESTTLGAGRPSDDLLDALSRHTASLRQTAPGTGGTAGRRPATPPSSPAPPAAGRGPVRHAPADLSSPPGPGLPARPAPTPPPTPPPGPAPASSGGPGEPGATGGGLTRRVRGAQLPTTSPLQLRRSDGTPHADGGRPSAPSPPAPRPPAPPSWAPAETAPPADRHSERADNVYGFLSSFTAGVQRGLDQAQRERHDPADDAWR
jgi:HAMP domain-containing protein